MISGFAAREVFVSSMALIYRIGDAKGDGISDKLLRQMRTIKSESTGKNIFTFSSVMGILVFYMIALQCFATVAVAKRESGSWKFALTQLTLFTGVGYLLAVLTVQGLRAFGVG